MLGVADAVAAAAEVAEPGPKSLVGVQVHWYPVLPIVVVTVTVCTGAVDGGAAVEFEELLINLPPITLAF